MTMKTATPVTLHTTHIDLPETSREAMVALLNQALAVATDLASQVKFAHWNVKGPQFFALHQLFDAMAEELVAATDTLAERATTLGGVATGTIRMAIAQSDLPEIDEHLTDGLDFVRALATRYALLAKHLRHWIDAATEAGDADTADLFTEVSREIDKRLWFLEAHFQG